MVSRVDTVNRGIVLVYLSITVVYCTGISDKILSCLHLIHFDYMTIFQNLDNQSITYGKKVNCDISECDEAAKYPNAPINLFRKREFLGRSHAVSQNFAIFRGGLDGDVILIEQHFNNLMSLQESEPQAVDFERSQLMFPVFFSTDFRFFAEKY